MIWLAVVIVPGFERSPSEPKQFQRPSVLASALLALGSFVGCVYGPALVRERKPPAHPLCSDAGKVQICAWPEDRKHLKSAVSAATRLNTLEDAGLTSPSTPILEAGLRERPEGELQWSTLLGPFGVIDGTAGSYAQKTLRPYESCKQYTTALLEFENVLSVYAIHAPPDSAFGYDTRDGVDHQKMTRIGLGSDSEVKAWITQRIATPKQSCHA